MHRSSFVQFSLAYRRVQFRIVNMQKSHSRTQSMSLLLLLLFLLLAIATVQQAVASPATGDAGQMQQLPPKLAEHLSTTYFQVVSEDAALPVDGTQEEEEDDERIWSDEENGSEEETEKDTCKSSGDACPSQSFFSWIVINL